MLKSQAALFTLSTLSRSSRFKMVDKSLLLTAESCLEPNVVKCNKYPRTLYPLYKNPHTEFGLESVPGGSGIPRHHHHFQSEILFVQRGYMKVYYWNSDSEDEKPLNEFLVGPNQAVQIPVGMWHSAINVTSEMLLQSNQVTSKEISEKEATLWITWTLMREDDGSKQVSSLTNQIATGELLQK